MQRPTAITILAILGFVSGGLHFLGAFLAFASGSWISAEARSGYYLPAVAPYVDALGGLGFWIGMFGMIAASITIAAACGLWVLSKFGYWLTIVALSANIILDVLQYISGNAHPGSLLGAVIAIGVIIYMFRPSVKEAFAGFPIDAPLRQPT